MYTVLNSSSDITTSIVIPIIILNFLGSLLAQLCMKGINIYIDKNFDDSENSEDSDEATNSEDSEDSDEAEDSDDSEDSDEAENFDDAEDSDNSEEADNSEDSAEADEASPGPTGADDPGDAGSGPTGADDPTISSQIDEFAKDMEDVHSNIKKRKITYDENEPIDSKHDYTQTRNKLSDDANVEDAANAFLDITKTLEENVVNSNSLSSEQKTQISSIIKGVPEFLAKIMDANNDQLDQMSNDSLSPLVDKLIKLLDNK